MMGGQADSLGSTGLCAHNLFPQLGCMGVHCQETGHCRAALGLARLRESV